MSLQIWLIAVGVIVALAALINLFRNGNRKDNSRHQSMPAGKAQHARHGTSHQAETAANLDDADHHITDHTLRRHAEAARMRGATAAHSVGDGNRLGPTATPSAAPSEGTHVRAEKTGLGSDTRAHTHTGSTSTVSTSTRQASGEARAHARSNDDRRGSIFGGTGALFPLLAAVAAGLASCQLGSAEGIRGIPATIGNLFGPAGSKVPVATIEATLPNAADVKVKAAEAVAVAK